jgi:hypothetical protein
MSITKEDVIVELYSIIEGSGIADLVDRNFLLAGDIPSNVKKAIMITDDEPENEIIYRSSDNADVDFTVLLVCHIETEENMSSEMNDFDQELKALLGSNRKLNGKAFSSQILPSDGREVQGNAGRFGRPLRIQYEGVVTDGL